MTQEEATNQPVVVGTVLQLSPESESVQPCFRGCFLVVTEVKSWGVQGYIPGVGASFEESGGLFFLRPQWADLEFVGEAVWRPE